jgi:hypothetical protein
VSKKSLPLWISFPVLIAISIAAFFFFYQRGIANDCKVGPGQIDGQCGLNTLAGMASGVFVSGAIFLIGGTILVIRSKRKKPSDDEDNQDINTNDNARK